jgi:glucose-1-phosphate cytidylyltransferase
MQTLILCGGKGTRAYPQSLDMPKPLMTVGDSPILHHIMGIFARQGFDQFVLAGGYRVDMLKTFADDLAEPWTVEVIDTGENTGTAGRIIRCAPALGRTFMATYGDGLGSIDVASLLRFHASHAGAVTVRRFVEKPRLVDHWINAGFFVFDDRVFDRWSGDDLEREVLPALADAGELYVHQHFGFWRSMDTYKDALELSALCAEGDGPWTTLAAPESSSPGPRASSDRISAGGS